MAEQIIDVGTAPNNGTGDPLRTAFIKTDNNFDQIWAAGPVGTNVRIQNNVVSTLQVNQDLALSPNGVGNVRLNNNTIPGANNTWFLGSTTNRWRGLYVGNVIAGNVSTTNLNVPGDAYIGGNLTVVGNTIQIGNITTDTKTIQLANTAVTDAAADGSGVTVGANDDIATFLYDSGNNVWTTNIGLQVDGAITGTSIAVSDATVYGNLAAINGNFTGNVTANYFFGNGSQLTGIQTGAIISNTAPALGNGGIWWNSVDGRAYVKYANAFIDLSPSLVPDPTTYVGNVSFDDITVTNVGNIIPAGNNAYSLGSEAFQWKDLWVSNNTIYINSVPITLGAGNVLTVAGNAVVTESANGTVDLANLAVDNNNIYNSTGLGVVISNFSFIDEAETAYVQIPAGNSASDLSVVQTQGNVRIAANTADWTFDATGNLTVPGTITSVNNVDLYAGDAATITSNNTGTTNTWTFDETGNLTLPAGTIIDDVSTDGVTLKVRTAPDTIDITGADFVAVNLTYTRDFGQAIPTWYPPGYNPATDPYIEFSGGEYGIFVPGFGQALYVNTGTFNNPLTQWNINPPLGSVPPTGEYTYSGSGSSWTFDTNGLLTLPGGDVAIGSVLGGDAILSNNAPFGVISQGNSGATVVQWSDDIANTTQLSAIYINGPFGNIGDIQVRTGDVSNANVWTFSNDGNLNLPSNTSNINYANGDSILDGYATISSTYSSNATTQSINVPDGGGTYYNASTLDIDYTAYTGASTLNFDIAYQAPLTANIGVTVSAVSTPLIQSNANIQIQANTGTAQTWTFDTAGDLSAPGNITAGNFIGAGSNVELIAQSEQWVFDTTGNLTLPTAGYLLVQTGIIGAGASPAPTLSGFSSIATTGSPGNISASGNLIVSGYANITGSINGGNMSLSGNITSNTAGYTIGYRDIPQVSFTANATAALTDAGKHFYSTTAGNLALTLPDNSSVAFPTGATLTIVVNAAGNVLVNQGTGVSLYQAGASATGNRVVGAYGLASVMKVAANTWVISGTGVY